jgi:hypothetical protein
MGQTTPTLTLGCKVKDANDTLPKKGNVLVASSTSTLEWAVPLPIYLPHVIRTTTGDVDGYYINSGTGEMCNMAYITSTAGTATGRTYTLPNGNKIVYGKEQTPPQGFTMYFTNLSGASWTVSAGGTAKILKQGTTNQNSAPLTVTVPTGTIALAFVYHGYCYNGENINYLWACNIA